MNMTIEEFTERVKKSFAVEWQVLSQSEIDEYFETEGTKEHIAQEYDIALRAVNEWRLTWEKVKNGRIGSVAECLALLY